MDLFDNPTFMRERGLIRMDRGICLAVEAQEVDAPGYGDTLYQCIFDVASEQETVHIDDVLKRFTLKPHHPNANAGPWRRCKNDRIITPSGMSRRCQLDAGKNAHVYPIYKSLIWRGQNDRNA